MGDFNCAIKLIATDLDGTLLDDDMEATQGNREALARCSQNGIHVVVATGRSFAFVPQNIKEIEEIEYLICANGAKIHNIKTHEQIYARYLSRESVESVWDLVSSTDIMTEICVDGETYVTEVCYNDPEYYGIPDWFSKFVTDSRLVVDDLPAFTKAHIDQIENIHFTYATKEMRDYLYERLSGSDQYELSAAMPFNWEIGGAGVNKADAIRFLCEKLDISPSETMCIGDNGNDVAMIAYAGIGVAMENAVPEARVAADFITLACEQDGVAYAINHIIFNES
jgi:Cof subfamily protein (haloacid dehalogenase superfamily)